MQEIIFRQSQFCLIHGIYLFNTLTDKKEKISETTYETAAQDILQCCKDYSVYNVKLVGLENFLSKLKTELSEKSVTEYDLKNLNVEVVNI